MEFTRGTSRRRDDDGDNDGNDYKFEMLQQHDIPTNRNNTTTHNNKPLWSFQALSSLFRPLPLCGKTIPCRRYVLDTWQRRWWRPKDNNEEEQNHHGCCCKRRQKRQQLQRLLWNITTMSIATLWLHVFLCLSLCCCHGKWMVARKECICFAGMDFKILKYRTNFEK